MLKKIEDNRHGLPVRDLIREINGRAFKILGDAALANPFGNR